MLVRSRLRLHVVWLGSAEIGAAVKEVGRFVVLVGPDGVGKTTLAGALLERWDGPGRYFHFCPAIARPLAHGPDPGTHAPPVKAPREGGRVLGWVRLGRNILRFWMAYVLRIKPAIRKGCLVVGDRWAYGYIGQPHGLKFYGPSWLALFAVRLLPSPDLLVTMEAPAGVIRGRKQELQEWEIREEMQRWGRLMSARRFTADATATPDALARVVLAELGS